MDDPLGDAVRWVREGGMLAYPTETVWGLGADATSDSAVDRLRAWKGRDADTPISILVEEIEMLSQYGMEVGPAARRLASEFWPGPLTLVLACRSRVAGGVARDDGAIGVRCSAHPVAAALARRLAREGVGPITSTSLNKNGAPPANSRADARAMCRADLAMPRLFDLEGAEAGGYRESTVVDVAGDRPEVLRWGGLPRPVLEPVLKEIAAS